MKKAVILLSGGLDSATTLGLAKSQDFECYALSIFYGQRNEIELLSSKKIADFFNVKEHKMLDLDLRLFGGSSLTDNIEVNPHNTYVPARNTIMLSLALAYAEVVGADDIMFGANIHDYSGYPDCRPEYVKAFEDMANLSTKRCTEGGFKIKIHAPLMDLTKAQIIKLGVGLGIDYAITHSCYNPIKEKACGACNSCLFRKKGFYEAGIKDPTVYLTL